MLERTQHVRQPRDDDVQRHRRSHLPRTGEHVASIGLVAIDALQVDRRSAAGLGPLDGLAMNLQPAHLVDPPGRQHRHGVAHAHRPRQQGARDHRPEPLHRKDAVHGHAQRPGDAIVLGKVGGQGQGGEDPVQPPHGLPLGGAEAAHRRLLEDRPRHRRPDVVLHEIDPVVVHEVALGQDDEGGAGAEEPTHVDMLSGLGHHPFVGGHHEHHHLDAARAGRHGSDKALMPRDIHDPKATTRHVEMREAQVDGDAPGLLLGQPIRVDAGQTAHQRRLAVVDVTCGADDQGLDFSAIQKRTRTSLGN